MTNVCSHRAKEIISSDFLAHWLKINWEYQAPLSDFGSIALELLYHAVHCIIRWYREF